MKNTKQLNKLTMYLAVEGVCDANPAAWQPLVPFAGAYIDVKTHVTNIQSLVQSQAQNNTGIAQDKAAARTAMCAVTLPVAKAVHAYAVKTGNNTLAKSVDFSMSDLVGGRDIQSRDNCLNIASVTTANLGNLAPYGVTAAKVTAITNAVAAYNLLISKPRDNRVVGKTITANLQAEFDAVDAALGIMDDLSGQIANPTFVSNYKNARIIVDAAASHDNADGPTPPIPPLPPVTPPKSTPTPPTKTPVPVES